MIPTEIATTVPTTRWPGTVRYETTGRGVLLYLPPRAPGDPPPHVGALFFARAAGRCAAVAFLACPQPEAERHAAHFLATGQRPGLAIALADPGTGVAADPSPGPPADDRVSPPEPAGGGWRDGEA